MMAEALWARAEEHRQLCALRRRMAQETPQADETPGSTDGRPGDDLLGVGGPSAFLGEFFGDDAALATPGSSPGALTPLAIARRRATP
jgi:hypothetical protein